MSIYSKLFLNQLDAIRQVLRRYKTINYVMLVAQMQSGKTGAFNGIAHEMLTKGMVKRVYIVCGTSDTLLYKQACDDAENYCPGLKVSIIFHQHFEKKIMKTKDALIIIDESHIDSDQGQGLDKFLEKHDLHLNGSTADMVENNTYILSVSATPFAEYSHTKYTCSKKDIVFMPPGDDYRGVKWYSDNGHIHETFDILHNIERFLDIVISKGNKYNIVRLKDCYAEMEFDAVLSNAAEEYGVPLTIRSMNSSDDSNFDIDDFEKSPSTPTIVIIQNKLRFGKVLCKKHIGFVWENTGCRKPDHTHTTRVKCDTILQGLLGRVCGYGLHKKSAIDIFLPPSLLNKAYIAASGTSAKNDVELYVEYFETCGELMPRTGRNIIGRTLRASKTPIEKYPAPILRFNKKDWEIPTEYRSQIYKNRKMIRAAVIAHSEYTDDQHTEILKLLSITNKDEHNYRNMGQFSQAPYVKHVFIDKMLPIEVIQSNNTAKSVYVVNITNKKGADEVLPEFAALEKYVYIVFQLDNPIDDTDLPLQYRIPTTKGTEIFARVPMPHTDLQYTIAAPKTVCSKPIVLKKFLQRVISLWKYYSDDEEDSEYIASNSLMMLRKYSLQYESRRIIDNIMTELQEEFDISITYSIRTTDDGYCLRKLTWS
jgi:hypothetical protein